MKLYLTNPRPVDNPQAPLSGVDQVVRAMYRYLPEHLELVGSPREAEVVAAHILPPGAVHADVLHCHGLYPTGEWPSLPAWCWQMNGQIVQQALAARQVTVPSEWVAEQFARAMGFSPTVVPHGLFLEEWPEPVKDKQGFVLWNKNRAGDVCDPSPVAALARALPEARFVTTYGDNAPNVQVTGLLPYLQMRDLLYQAGVYLATTKETFGIGILEALAAGVPVVGWRWGSVPRIVRDRHDGYLCDPYDYEATAEGVRYCLENAARLSANARQTALSYDWREIIPRYLKVYQGALSPTEGPRVSVVIPCHNYAAYVGAAIRSVQAQTYTDWECIVVDDGSTDDSVRVITEAIAGDGRCRLIATPNRKVAAARNLGAQEARGEFLVFLDADDYLNRNFLEALLPAMVDRTVGVAYGGLEIQMGDERKHSHDWPGDWSFSQQLLGRNQIPSACLVRKDAWRRAGGYREHTIPAEDAELWTRIGLCGYRAVRASVEPVMVYRVHERSATAQVRTQKRKEPDWLAWIPAAKGGPQPFGSAAVPENLSHPVVSYDRPMVSVVTPVGDGHEDLLERAIESVAAQLYPLWEHVVVDDTTSGGLSKWGTIPYAERYPWVRWVRKRKPGNVSAARNLGVKRSRGRWLLFLDADDELDREFLYHTVPVARERGQSLIYTDWVSLPEGKTHRAAAWDVAKLVQEALFVVTYLHPRAAFDAVGGFDESVPIWEDWDYTVRLAAAGYRGIHVPRPLFLYHYEGGHRREECLKRRAELVDEFHARFLALTFQPPRDAPLALSAAPVAPARVARPDGQVLVEYVGSNQGARTYRTPLGRKYRFDGNAHKRQWVRSDDLHFFVRMDTFHVVEK